ncbi:hypothetical protein [Mycolicibacterium sp. HK-90]|uniref:hypothetical protein n=1 Tax=Mycolicibacterium sp. HK-90 TaxID=3056937 RepID=UPI002657E816|nr:hypothetical protein [Mycolicibacterium sp. HK-90]WKG05156.1 hypothetical protein QU592_08750 [Mycolicibacterium sp. HK-90]
MRGTAVARDEDRPRRIRVAIIAALLIAALAVLLTQCPANRDGTPGQLAKAMEETVAAARSGAYALDLRLRDRTTPQVVSVQISDAREEVVKAYEGIADLKADDPVDLDRQRMLTEVMTTVIGQLGSASARVREITAEPDLAALRDQLRASADELEAGYR